MEARYEVVYKIIVTVKTGYIFPSLATNENYLTLDILFSLWRGDDSVLVQLQRYKFKPGQRQI